MHYWITFLRNLIDQNRKILPKWCNYIASYIIFCNFVMITLIKDFSEFAELFNWCVIWVICQQIKINFWFHNPDIELYHDSTLNRNFLLICKNEIFITPCFAKQLASTNKNPENNRNFNLNQSIIIHGCIKIYWI